MEDVHVGFEQRFDGSLTGIDANGDGTEDTRDVDSVSWLNEVNELIVSAQGNGVRRLSIGYSI